METNRSKVRVFTPAQLERARQRAQEWRNNNRERHRAYQREYRLKNAEECYARNRAWATSNPELVNEYHRRSRRKRPAGYHANALRWRAKNPDARRLFCANRRARIRGNGGKITPEQWHEIKARAGFRCLGCGKRKPLTLDHVVPISKGGAHSSENIQPLCLSCNSGKCDKTIDYRPN